MPRRSLPRDVVPREAVPREAVPREAVPLGDIARHRWLELTILLPAIGLLAAGHSLSRTAPHSLSATLRVCADPNNMPFSDREEQGFDNQVAALIAADLGRSLQYIWYPQRRGFIRHTIGAGVCDLVVGVPNGLPGVRTTRPFYRSTYVFVTRADRQDAIRSLDDPRLRTWRVGLHFTGGSSNPPPSHALARRGIIDNVVAYSIYGDYGTPSPPTRLIDAVAAGDIDVAIAWGPMAGYTASREPIALRVTPVAPSVDGPGVSFPFDLAVGLPPADSDEATAVQRVLDRRRDEITAILKSYHVPLLALAPEGPHAAN